MSDALIVGSGWVYYTGDIFDVDKPEILISAVERKCAVVSQNKDFSRGNGTVDLIGGNVADGCCALCIVLMKKLTVDIDLVVLKIDLRSR